MGASILIIEDEPHIARILQLELEHEGYRVTHAAEGQAGLQQALAQPFDLIILDVMLPEMDGMTVLRHLRSAKPALPVIMLTAKGTEQSKIEGLDSGANDYVTKPFSTAELLARIRSLLRHSPQKQRPEGDWLAVADLTIDTTRRRVVRSGKEIELTPREFELLAYFMSHPSEILTREQILTDVWGFDFVGDTNLVDVYIRYLRQKVDSAFKLKLIQTHRGVGYSIRGQEA